MDIVLYKDKMPSRVLTLINTFYSSMTYSDAFICARDGHLKAHRLILGAASPLIRAAVIRSGQTSDQTLTILLPDFSIKEIDAFLQVIYGVKGVPVSEATATLLCLCGLGHIFEVQKQKERKRSAPDDEDSNLPLVTDLLEGFGDVSLDLTDAEDEKHFSPVPQVKSRSFPGRLRNSYLKKQLAELDMEVPGYGRDPQIDNNGRFLCPVINCDHHAPLADLLNNHIATCHTKMKCGLCNERCPVKDLPLHVSSRHLGVTDYTEARLQPPIRKRPNSKKSVKAAADGQYQCEDEDCDYRTRERPSYETHLKSHHAKIVCPQCDKVIGKANMSNHVRRAHSAVGRYECIECSKPFHDMRVLDTHLRDFHNYKSGTASCRYCGRMFGLQASIAHHELTCVPPPEKKRRFYSRRIGRTAHIKVPFRDDKPDCCPEEGCDYTNVNKFKIKSHYIHRHCRQKCPHCQVILNYYHMERHIAVMHTKQLDHQCDICSASFFEEWKLKDHIDEEHVKESKFICEECGKDFFSLGKLKTHKNKCRKDKYRFHCTPCGKSYTCKSSLIKHLRRYHGGEGINALFQHADGNWKQMRQFKHIVGRNIAEELEVNVKEQSFGESGFNPRMPQPSSAAARRRAASLVTARAATTVLECSSTADLQVNV